MYIPPAVTRQREFEAVIAEAARKLAPEVVDIIPALDNDWAGDPAVFLMVILADSAAKRDQLRRVTNAVSDTILQDVRPLEDWGVRVYFNYRSQSEQAKYETPVMA